MTLRDNTDCPETITMATYELLGTNPEEIKTAIELRFAGNLTKVMFRKCGMELLRK
jgi:UDP-N-acetylglucosamine 2-epimerase (non-hydrolysing)